MESCQIAVCSYKCFSGASESSWDKDKLQSPLAAPGPQHGLTHAALSNQPGLGGTSTLNPLQQNNLLTNSMYDVISKLGVLKKKYHARPIGHLWLAGLVHFSSIRFNSLKLEG